MPNLLIEQAKCNAKRAADNTFSEPELVDELTKLIDFDVQREKRKKAKKMIDDLAKPGSTEPSGQLCLPGLEPYDYEPERLVRDEQGRIVENAFATPSFKTAEAKRARKHAREATVWSDIKSEEVETISTWAMKELMRGRPATEINWGTCVKELGLWNAPAVVNPMPEHDDHPRA